MTTTAQAAPALPAHVPSPVEPLPNQILTALGQHRIATTGQLQAMLRPAARRQTVNTPLNELRRQGLVDYTVLPRSRGMRAWYAGPAWLRWYPVFPRILFVLTGGSRSGHPLTRELRVSKFAKLHDNKSTSCFGSDRLRPEMPW